VALHRIAKRQEQVAEAKDLLCEYAPHAARRLFLLMGQATSEETRRKAATDVLDRADEATASKRPEGAGIEQILIREVVVEMPGQKSGDEPVAD